MANINQIYAVINAAAKEAYGGTAITVKDLRSLISLGDYVMNSSSADSKDVFTGKILDLVGKTVFVNRARKSSDLGLSKDEFEWGAILRKIRVKPIETRNNDEYNFDGTGYNPFSVDIPAVDQKLFSKFGTISVEITITDEQLFTAFKGNEELSAFYSLIYKQMDDAISRSTETYDRLALDNFIGEKLVEQAAAGNTKIHAVNLLAGFKAENPSSTLTASTCLKDKDFLRYAATEFQRWMANLETETDVFNSSDGYLSQTYGSYFRFYMLSMVKSLLENNLYSDTFHYNFNEVKGFKTVNFWQGPGTDFGFDSISKINVKTASNNVVEQGGILAVMMDEDAVATYYNRAKSESWRVPKVGTKHYRAWTKAYLNDLYENGIIFYIDDVEDNISNLAFSAGTLSPAFASTTTSYTLSISAATSSSELTFDLDEGASAVVKKGTTKITPSQGVYNITGLADNDKITVEVQKFDIKTVYTITVDKADS